jgi:hypothetical protein
MLLRATYRKAYASTWRGCPLPRSPALLHIAGFCYRLLSGERRTGSSSIKVTRFRVFDDGDRVRSSEPLSRNSRERRALLDADHAQAATDKRFGGFAGPGSDFEHAG